MCIYAERALSSTENVIYIKGFTDQTFSENFVVIGSAVSEYIGYYRLDIRATL